MATRKFEINQQLKNIKPGDSTVYLVSGINEANRTYSIKGGTEGKQVLTWDAAHELFQPVSIGASAGGPPTTPPTPTGGRGPAQL